MHIYTRVRYFDAIKFLSVCVKRNLDKITLRAAIYAVLEPKLDYILRRRAVIKMSVYWAPIGLNSELNYKLYFISAHSGRWRVEFYPWCRFCCWKRGETLIYRGV